MTKLVTIIGGSGFLGRYIARRMAKEGWRVRVAVRRPNEAMFVRTYGAVGQVEPILCNIRDDASVAAAVVGADAVVNCVGVLTETGKNTFEAVQAEGAARVAEAAAQAGVGHMVQISAIGADPEGASDYARTKAEGEAAVLASMPDAMIVRPSIMFGDEDEFFNRFAGMTRFGPVLPVVGADTRFQPVYVDDVAAAVVEGVKTGATGVYEFGGPDTETLRGLMERMLRIVMRRRLILNIPFGIARIMAPIMGAVQFLTLGIVKAPFTKDQLINLGIDNVVSDDAKGLGDLGVHPKAMEAILPSYLWRFRPSGQFDAIKESAKHLRNN